MNSIIIASSNHPLYEQLAKLQHPFYTIDSVDHLDIIEDHQDACVYDFTLFSTDDKDRLFACLKGRYSIVSDLSCAWGELLHQKYPELKASFAAAFYSPKQTIECFNPSHSNQELDAFFVLLKLGLEYVSDAGHGFIYPRTVSMIINEAYFAFDDQLASKENIDQAMKFGVNYPHGPFEWGDLIKLTPIKMLLTDLYAKTQDERYKMSKALYLQEQLS